MRFDEYWKSDLDFDFYVEDLNKQSIIARKWLHDLLSEKTKISTRGIILTADMGYGKSSIISNIICAEENSALRGLRQSVFAYHMCRYDVKLSLKPETFIRNLAGKLVKTIPEVGNAILSDDRALDFLYSMKCAEDPISCAEFSIFNPMKNLSKERTYFLVIDALDECDTLKTTNIISLLNSKMNSFPLNVKFIFTTRNIEQLLYKFKKLERIDLQNFENFNSKDIREYIELSQKLNKKEIKKLSDDVPVNFLYIKLKLKYCEDIGIKRCDEIPESLEKIYSLNFERVFGERGTLFDEFINLFEVLCTIQNPIEEAKLFQIAGLNTDEKIRKANQIIGNELGHFIKFSLGRISFHHKSLSEFLTNSSRKHLPFYINQKNGHKLFAAYLIKTLNLTENDNLVEIAHHVTLSAEKEYEDIFLASASEWKIRKIDRNYAYLYEAAREVNNYKTVRIIIQLVTSDNRNNTQSISSDQKKINLHLKKVNMSMAAFIAAANGNEESLRAFLEFGAIIDYINHDKCIINHTPLNELDECKYESFLGYNYMHIAAQRGHIKVVQYLVDKSEIMLYQKNRYNLTAFQLAAEHGHFLVLETMLKFNTTLADPHALHHAAENGHLKAVKILLQYVNDTCLPCNGSIYWRQISKIHYFHLVKRIPHYILRIEKDHDDKDIFYDDWRLLTCETALHAAIKNGHFDVVSTLLKKSKLALNCELFDGSTPLMTAIRFNRTKIFQFLFQIGANYLHTCKGVSAENLDTSKLCRFEFDWLKNNACPNNGSIAHLIAMHDNIGIIQFLKEKGYELWNTPDAEGNRPLHYAFCRNSFNFIKTFVFEKSISLNLTVRSHNGSTPFHSAAICKSPLLYRYFKGTERYSLSTIPDSMDNFNTTILQYGLSVLVDEDELIRINHVGKDEITHRLFELVLNSNHNLLTTDAYNQNFLHYAAESGNYWAFLLILSKPEFLNEKDVMTLLFQKDRHGRIPFKVAFDALSERKSFEPLKIPHNCSLNEVFFETCNTNYSILLSPHEYLIFVVSQFFHSNRYFSYINLTDLVSISVKKSRLYPILILKTYAENDFNDIFNSTEFTNLVFNSNIPFLGELILDIANYLQCNGKESILHRVLQNDRSNRWRFSLAFLHRLFEKYSVIYLDNCYDRDGYSLLHRAVIGGNIQTVSFLITQGMNLWTMSKQNESLLEIILFKSPYMINGSLPTYYNTDHNVLQYVFQSENGQAFYTYYDINFDKTAAYIFEQMDNSVLINRTRIKEQLCKPGSYGFGLIHMAAAKGFISFLQRVKKVYGVNILNCQDNYNVTPVYLAKLYNQILVVNWLSSLHVLLKRPTKDAERFLVYNILNNYRSKLEYDWVCFLRYGNQQTALIKTVIEKCIMKCAHFPILYDSFYKNMTVLLFKIAFKQLVNIKCNDANVVSMNRYFVNCLKTVINYHVYDLFKLLILFGYADKEFHYQHLMSQYTTLVSTNFKPLTIRDAKRLFSAIFEDKYYYFSVLKMRKDLHIDWLKDKLRLDLSNDLRTVDRLGSFAKQQIKRFQEILFPVELDDGKFGVPSRICENWSEAIERKVVSLKHGYLSCSHCFIGNMRKWLSSIKTNENLHNIARRFFYTMKSQAMTEKSIARRDMDAIRNVLNTGGYQHEVIEFNVLMKRTFRKLSQLPKGEKQTFYIISYRQYLNLILHELEHYFEYEDILI